MAVTKVIGDDAIKRKGWLKANKWLILRRITQFAILGLFLTGPLFGVWIVKGNLTSSLTLDLLPLSDPFVLLQGLFARHWPETTALIGAAIVLAGYLIVGGRAYCAFVCPINLVTDAAALVHRRLGLKKGWQPKRATRFYVLAMVMATALVSGTLAYELLNPVTIVHRGLVFGMGWAWGAVVAIFLFDVFVAMHGWCGHLCPMGAFYGLLGEVSLVRARADDRANCNDCLDCFAICPEPQVITPALRGEKTGHGPVITSGACTNCGRCIDVCSENVFRFGLRFDGTVEPVIKEGATS
jgi:ferredoxin-type protein NapH